MAYISKAKQWSQRESKCLTITTVYLRPSRENNSASEQTLVKEGVLVKFLVCFTWLIGFPNTPSKTKLEIRVSTVKAGVFCSLVCDYMYISIYELHFLYMHNKNNKTPKN